MKKHPLITLFCTNLVILAIGHGLFPLLPIYASTFHATSRIIGLYLAVVSASITAGALLPGWLPEHISRKRLLIFGSIPGVPALMLLSQATTLWQVIPLTGLLWCSAGFCLALSSVYTARLSSEQHRGRAFSLVALSTPLGLLFGGLLVGSIVSWREYSFTFLALALLWSALPCAYAITLEDAAAQPRAASSTSLIRDAASQGRFLILLAGALLSAACVSVSQMGASLSMQALIFSPAAISSTATAAGLVMIPIVLLMSVCSDRLGHRRFLMVGYLLTAGGAVALGAASALWHFWAAIALLRVGQVVNDSMAPALATDLLPPARLGQYLPRLKATNWLAGTLSFIGAGYAIDTVGTGPVFITAAFTAVVAAGLLVLVPMRWRARALQSSRYEVTPMPASPAGAPETGNS